MYKNRHAKEALLISVESIHTIQKYCSSLNFFLMTDMIWKPIGHFHYCHLCTKSSVKFSLIGSIKSMTLNNHLAEISDWGLGTNYSTIDYLQALNEILTLQWIGTATLYNICQLWESFWFCAFTKSSNQEFRRTRNKKRVLADWSQICNSVAKICIELLKKIKKACHRS